MKANLLDTFKSILKESNWDKVNDDDKEEFFFIMNRHFSKRYPEKSQLLNKKNIDKVSSMDLWHNFIKKEPYPKWFWSKSGVEKTKDDYSEKDMEYIIREYNFKKEDVMLIHKLYPDKLKEEIKYLKTDK